MDKFFEDFLKEYMPRAACMYYENELIFLHLIGDGMIFIAYFAIGILLLLAANKVPSMFEKRLVILFGAFIFLCGLTHAMDVLAIWHTYYKLDGILKVATGIVSLATLFILPNSAKRAKEMAEYVELKEKTDEAVRKANEAETRANKLEQLVKHYEAKEYK